MKIITNSSGKKFKMGRNRIVALAPRLSLANYLLKALPTPPPTVNYLEKPAIYLADSLGNDDLACCTASAAFHAGGTFLANAGSSIPFTLEDVIAFYSATGGYVVGNPSTDNGCDEQTVLNYWMQHGLTPNAADTHRIGGFCHINGANKEECQTALWLFENLYFGVQLPDLWVNPMPENSGFSWGAAGAADPENGHAFAGLAYDQDGVLIDSWGLIGLITWDAIAEYTTNGGDLYTVLSSDSIDKAAAKAPTGFNYLQMQADLQAIQSNLTPVKRKIIMPPVKGQQIDPGEMVVAKAAVKATADTMTYMGVNIGSHITDAECTQMAAAVVTAIENFRANKKTI
jgi:hypothetical protein